MKQKRYEFDGRDMRYRKARVNVLGFLGTVLKVVLVSLSLFIVLYFILATFLSTDTEKRLAREIRAYEKAWQAIPERDRLLDESISLLENKDNSIYRNVFHNEAPSVDPMGSLGLFFGADSVPDTRIVSYTAEKAARLVRQSERVDSAFAAIYRSLASSGGTMPPMSLPVEDISYPQVGASAGQKLNPILMVDVNHRGIDFIVPRETEVHAPADGTVEQVVRSSKGDGNTVVLSHEGGYRTRYCHLEEINVKEGQAVRKGRVIGTTGMSGDAFAPHLHYEVLRYGLPADPVNYIFASVTPKEYSNMLYMAVSTRQSMD